MSAGITNYSAGRRWRCHRASGPSFDFIILGPGAKENEVRCRIEPLPDQERVYGKSAIDRLSIVQSYTRDHLRRVAVLQPITLDDIAGRI